MHKLKSKNGFTLIEILVVVSIIGLLAGVVLTGVGQTRSKARDSKRIQDLGQIQLALEQYNVSQGTYPVLQCISYSGTDCVAQLKSGLGVSRLPQDPKSGQTYMYASNGSTYTLGTRLEAGDENLPPLKDSLRGTSNGIDCAPPTYCVTF